MNYEPKPYQLLIRELILGGTAEPGRCNVFARMGMGKTVETLTCVDMMNEVFDTQTLVIAPKRVALSVWPAEVEKWDHLGGLRVSAIIGSQQERLLALKQDANVFTINYDNVPWLVDHYAQQKRWPFKRVIADESARLRGFRLRQGGARASALARVAHGPVKEWINLTGTPAPNGLANLWGPQWFIDCGRRLGHSYEAFKRRWFGRSWDGYGLDPHPHAQDQIQRAIADTTIALDPKDWFDLKTPVVRNIYVELPPTARQKYREMERLMYTELEHAGKQKGIEAVNAAARTTKCLQLANGAAYVEYDEKGKAKTEVWADVHGEKLEALESIIEENGEPTLVAYQWKSDLARLRKAFPQAKTLDDAHAERDWNAGRIPVLLAHPASAGHGLNLQHGGRTIVFFGMWWDLELYEQIIERIGPMRQLQAGLDRNVFIYHILARDTVDEDVLERHQTKAEVQDILMRSQRRRRSK